METLQQTLNNLGQVIHQNSCQDCPVNFSCQRLKDLLALYEKQVTNPSIAPRDINTYYRLKLILEEQGWNYPRGNQKCQLQDCPHTINDMARQMTRLYRRIDFGA